MIDNDIIRLCQKGDQTGYKTMYTMCAPYVFAIVKNYLSKDDDRKDVIQEIFAQIFLSINRFDESKGSFKSWISSIAIHQTIATIRKNNRLIITHPLDQADEAEADITASIENFSEEDLQLLLKEMPSGYKTIFLLSVIEEYSHKEIGEMLNITAETSRSQLFRAIKWIKKKIFIEKNIINYGLQ